MKTNLLLLDSYNNIKNLIHFSFSLTRRLQRSLKIIYVNDFDWMRLNYISGVGTTGFAQTAIIDAEKNASREFEIAETKIRDIVADYIKNNKVHFPLEINVSKTNRIQLVKEELKRDPDLMVLINNHQSYKESTGGFITYPNLVEHVDCPVFVIPKNHEHAIMNNVVYASNYNPDDVRTLQNLTGFLKNSKDTQLTVLHNEENFDFNEKLKWTGYKEMVQSEIDFDGLHFALTNNKDFLKSIEEISEESKIDLLVMMKEKKGFFKDILSQNKTKYVLSNIDKPILVYHEH